MKEEIKKLNPILIELDDELQPHEYFSGMSASMTDEGQTVFVGLVEKFDDNMRPVSKRYVNIKAKHLKPKNDTFTKEDLKAAFYAPVEHEGAEGVITKITSFDQWFDLRYPTNKS
jgi:hypothetical protein